MIIFFRMEKLIKIRDSMTKFRRLRLSPIERGWSGTRMPGRSIGPPDTIGDGKNPDSVQMFLLKNNLANTSLFIEALCLLHNGMLEC